MTAKQSGASCPSCQEPCCAEYAMKDQPPRWRCGACGAGGSLVGAFIGRDPKPLAKQQPVKKNWRGPKP